MQASEYSNIVREEKRHFWYQANRSFTQALLKKYIPSTKIKILDAGCGVGGNWQILAKWGRVIGIDNHKSAIKHAKRYSYDKLLLGDVNNLPFSDKEFDLVTSFDVLYHQQVIPQKAISEFFRVLKPGGWLLVRVPAFEFLTGPHDLIVKTKHRFTTQEIKELFIESGFGVVKLTYFNASLFLPLLVKRHFFNKLGSDIGPLPQFINWGLRQWLRLEEQIAQVVDLPFGTSVYCLASKLKSKQI